MKTPSITIDQETISQINLIADYALKYAGVGAFDAVSSINLKLQAAAQSAKAEGPKLVPLNDGEAA